MSSEKVKRNWWAIGTMSLAVAAGVFFALAVTWSIGTWSIGRKDYHPLPQQKTTEGYYVYYLSSARISRNQLIARDIKGHYIEVVDIEKNLKVTVDPKYEGTALVIKHWVDRILDNADSAELMVRTKEHKAIWEEAIQEALERYQEELKPQDVLPETSEFSPVFKKEVTAMVEKKEPDFPTILSEMKGRFYQKREFYELASKHDNPPYLAARMSARGEIIQFLGWRYYAKKDFFHQFTSELEGKDSEQIEIMLRDKGVAEEDLLEMMAFFRGYLGGAKSMKMADDC